MPNTNEWKHSVRSNILIVWKIPKAFIKSILILFNWYIASKVKRKYLREKKNKKTKSDSVNVNWLLNTHFAKIVKKISKTWVENCIEHNTWKLNKFYKNRKININGMKQLIDNMESHFGSSSSTDERATTIWRKRGENTHSLLKP